ncbi:hypothetical protein GZH47_32920 (plasmid) [Paenibacillus rhizovicinus]|uniref:LysM peptidoglycan-binding domain-containing protein n=1 Tax=Paenibacillus rhizovicinus TaxID=2704463 RepID=A0A6C0PAY6_9BACL|nr:hypothetical protein [Paenibacillus rhizovicinus]QHW35697.1 hypothetical protein GZH47_32920 [Paenibacillus rhizovicinus]
MKIRVVNVKRFAIACVTVGVVLGSAITLLVSNHHDTHYTYKNVVASKGDTLWTLVRQYNPDYSGDVRVLVHMASKHNGSSSIDAATVVSIPVQEGN